MAATFLFQMPRYSRILVLLVGPLLFLFLLLSRGLLARLGAGARAQGFAFRRVLLLGSGSEVENARGARRPRAGTNTSRSCGRLHRARTRRRSRRRRASALLVDTERIQIVCVVPSRTRFRTCSRWPRHSATRGCRLLVGIGRTLGVGGGRGAKLGLCARSFSTRRAAAFLLRARKRVSDLAPVPRRAPAVGQASRLPCRAGRGDRPRRSVAAGSLRRTELGRAKRLRIRPLDRSPRVGAARPRIRPPGGRLAFERRNLGPEGASRIARLSGEILSSPRTFASF
jgi:hypothetical protein